MLVGIGGKVKKHMEFLNVLSTPYNRHILIVQLQKLAFSTFVCVHTKSFPCMILSFLNNLAKKPGHNDYLHPPDRGWASRKYFG